MAGRLEAGPRGALARAARLALACAGLCGPAPGQAASWATTELQLQYGELDVPAFATGGAGQATQPTPILTVQHASGWFFGEVFFFVDFLEAVGEEDYDFNDGNAYAELYLDFSSAKLAGVRYGQGWLRDLGALMGFNYDADAEVLKYLPGVRLALAAPGFDFLNLDLTAYLDDSAGLAGGGAPAQSDSFMVDLNWARPFRLGDQRLAVEGHVEYVGARRDELGRDVEAWLLAQPQLRWDLGYALFGRADRLFAGTELQWWVNKLGEGETDEFALQALLVWRL